MAIPGQDNRRLPVIAAAVAEYPCVRRLRHRRLLNFLRLEGLDAAFASMAGETDACFSMSHLRRMVERGQWNNAMVYLCRFLPPEMERMGLEAQVLIRFLVAQSALASILAGTREGAELAVLYSQYGKHGGPVDQGVLRLANIMLSVFHMKHQLRTSLDWERVRRKVSEIVDDLARRVQELKGLVLEQMKKPIRPAGSRRGCHQNQQSRPRPSATAVAKHYLQKKSSLHSSSHSQDSHDAAELSKKAMNRVVDLVDECLKAGKRVELRQEHPLMTSGRAGPAFPPARPATLGTFAGPVTYPGKLYVDNAGKFANNVPATGAPSLRTMFGVPTVYGRVTNPDKGSGMSLMTDARSNKHWSKEGCNEEASSQQVLNLQNDPRVFATSDEQDRDPKRQRAAGSFGEAILM